MSVCVRAQQVDTLLSECSYFLVGMRKSFDLLLLFAGVGKGRISLRHVRGVGLNWHRKGREGATCGVGEGLG